MKRRAFLSSLGAASVAAPLFGSGLPAAVGSDSASEPHSSEQLAGMSLAALRKRFHEELFDVLLPFWEQHGIDHQYGGVMCNLDYDGTAVNTSKMIWFQGRAIWIYSFLYNNFGQDPRHLEIARKAKDFLLQYAAQDDGWWAEVLTREGKIITRYSGDIEGVYFIVEGLQEYAAAAKDDHVREMALSLFKKLFRIFNQPTFRYAGPNLPDLKSNSVCVRPQGTWMLNLNAATQVLNRWHDAEIASIADQSVDAIINHHYNPEIGLNTEILNFDFSRPAGEERKVRIGHGIEVMWMVMNEADRRNDPALWKTCAERMRRHLDVGWDRVYGGTCQWVNVDQGGYQWPPETPVGTDFAFRFVGEYNYMKTLWGMCEVLVGCLTVYERTGAEWAANYFAMAYEIIVEKFSQKKRNLPGYALFTDRKFTFEPHVARQDNYHPLRQLMLNLLTLDRMIASRQRGG